MASVLSTQQLGKRFGLPWAVAALNLEVGRGEVFGILGPNGSGKTTTLGMVLGVTRPSAGSYRWFDEPPTAKARRRIGALLERPNFCPWLPARDNLKVVAAIRGLSRPAPAIETALGLVKLAGTARTPFQNFSLGMKQRLAVAAALLGEPEVLVLDEPTNGVDAEGIAEIRDVILSLAHAGKTIILASHILDEVEKVCSHVAVLKGGRMIESGAISSVLASGDGFELAADDMAKLESAVHQLKERGLAIASVSPRPPFLYVALGEGLGAAELNERLYNEGVRLSHLVRRKRSLEAHFLELLGKN